MAIAKRMLEPELSPLREAEATAVRRAPPRLLRCLVVAVSPARRRLIRTAAESQAWEAIICRDAGEFLREAFKRAVPLIVVDLPPDMPAVCDELRAATEQAKQVNSALVVVAGSSESEERWARVCGAWSFLSEARSAQTFEFVFKEARTALRRSRDDLIAADWDQESSVYG